MAEIDDFTSYLDLRGYDVDTGDMLALLAKAGDYILSNYHLCDSSTFSAADTLRYQTAKFMLANDFSTNDYALKKSAAVKREMDSASTGLFSDNQFYEAPTDLYPDITNMLAPLVWNANVPNFSVGKLTRGDDRNCQTTFNPDYWSDNNEC